MTQYNPQFPGYPPPQMPPAQAPPADNGRRRFPFVAGYVLWFLPALWRDAGRRWRGIGFFYMLILLAISWAVAMATGHGSIAAFVQNKVPEMAREVPTIDITDGVVTTDVEEPYVITNPDTHEPVIVIDTTGETTEPPPNPPSVLLTRDKLIMRDKNKVQTFDLSEVKEFHLDAEVVQGFFDKFLSLYWSLWYPLLLALSMLWRLVQMLLYGLIAFAVGTGVRPPLKFSASMRIAALAVTPVIVIDTIAMALGFGHILFSCGWVLLAIVLEIVLLILMVRSNNDPTAPRPGGSYYPAPAGPPMGGTAPYGYVPQGYAPPVPQGYSQGYPPPQPAQPPLPPQPPPRPPAGY